ncbi:MAG: hypothetical protein ACFE94_02055 [Candidatus Hodarchaeota archaeon]
MSEVEKLRKAKIDSSVGGICWIVIGIIIIVVSITLCLWMRPRTSGWTSMPLTSLNLVVIIIILVNLGYIIWKAKSAQRKS